MHCNQPKWDWTLCSHTDTLLILKKMKNHKSQEGCYICVSAEIWDS